LPRKELPRADYLNINLLSASRTERIPPQFHRLDTHRLLNTTAAPDSHKYTQKARGMNQVFKPIQPPRQALTGVIIK
jgi:hypothetical protein